MRLLTLLLFIFISSCGPKESPSPKTAIEDNLSPIANTKASTQNVNGTDYTLTFNVDEITPSRAMRLRSEGCIIHVKRGAVIFNNESVNQGGWFNMKKDDYFITESSGVVLWRWDFNMNNNTDLSFDGVSDVEIPERLQKIRGPISMSSSSTSKVSYAPSQTELENGLALKLEKFEFKEKVLVNNINNGLCAISVMESGEIKLLNGSKVGRSQYEESWAYECGTNFNISIRKPAIFYTVFVTTKDQMGKTLNIPSMISKSTNQPKGSQQLMLDATL